MRWLASILFAGLLVAVVGCLTTRSEPVIRGSAPTDDETDHLEHAANKLKLGDDAAAIKHLQAHIQASPDAVMVRAYLAELFYKSGDARNARTQFARFVQDADRLGGTAAKQHRVHAHTRLMELAQELNDPAAEARHRGVGLVLLAEPWERDTTEWETTMSQAVVVLRQATELQPDDAVAWYYLAVAQERMGQPAAAEASARRVLRLLPHAAISADRQLQLEEWCGGQWSSLK
jgi:tetratricopeptide (TPR) repeat protein